MAKQNGFRSFMNSVIIAREKQAKRYVNSVLLNMDETTLREAGFNRSELKREGASTSLPF